MRSCDLDKLFFTLSLKDSEGGNFCYYSAVTLRFPVLGLDLDTTSPLQSKSNFLEILVRLS